MVKIESLFGIGDDVEHFTGIAGRITAIFHRNGQNCYEFTHLDSEGRIVSINCEECELSTKTNNSMGFGRNGQFTS